MEEKNFSNIDLEILREEQRKLAKQVLCKDAFDFNLATRFGAIFTLQKGNSLIAAAVVLDEKLEVIEKKFSIQKIRFPYIPGFRAFRELPVMLEVYEKIEENPDVIFIFGNGIAHQLGIGIASHFGVVVNKPTIGVAKKVTYGIEENNQVKDPNKGKIIAEKIQTKAGSKPIYISPGHMICLSSAINLVKKTIKPPHKLPEPLVESRRFAKEIARELH